MVNIGDIIANVVEVGKLIRASQLNDAYKQNAVVAFELTRMSEVVKLDKEAIVELQRQNAAKDERIKTLEELLKKGAKQ
jgi:glycerol dehydrogenase-like iron-containing ADH family enzyme